jgi:hypothetical protein
MRKAVERSEHTAHHVHVTYVEEALSYCTSVSWLLAPSNTKAPSSASRSPSRRFAHTGTMLGLQMEHAWDDIDLGELASPARPGSHRRSRSDPSEMLQAIREERNAAGDAAQMRPKWDAEGANDGAQAAEVVPKRNLSPAKATGFSPAMKKHASIQPSHHQRTSLLPPAFDFADGAGDLEAGVGSSGEGGAGDEDEAAELVIMPPPVNFPLAGGLVVPSAEDFEAAAGGEKAPKNYSKKDVPMWTVEEDLLILKLVEQVRHHSRQGPKMNASASAHQPPPACAAPFNPLRASWVGVDKCAGPASGRGGPIARARTHTLHRCNALTMFLPRLRVPVSRGSSTASAGRRSLRTCPGAPTTACATGGTGWSARRCSSSGAAPRQATAAGGAASPSAATSAPRARWGSSPRARSSA